VIPVRLPRLVRLFPGKQSLTRESLLRVGLEPAEAFTGDQRRGASSRTSNVHKG
jgi:hypothetical protein